MNYNQNLDQIIATTGQYPAITLTLMPLVPPNTKTQGIVISTFLEYAFKASVVQPIADFSFTFVYPYGQPATQFIHEGDIVLLSVNLNGQDYPLSQGIIDTLEIQVTGAGETITIMGRDLLGQWEDQSQYQLSGKLPLYPNVVITPQQLYYTLAQNTRSQSTQLRLQNIPNTPHPLGVDPTESKLQIVTRYLEPYNALVWCGIDGKIVWGKPNMVVPPLAGVLIVSKSQGISNCLSMRATKSAFTVPATVRPYLSGQEAAAGQDKVIFSSIQNPFAEVKRLASLGCQLTSVYVTSDPGGSNPQLINSAVSLTVNEGVQSKMHAYALRQMAKDNMRILQVQAVVPGHVNAGGLPFTIDSCYQIVFDRAEIDCSMYLYEAEYTLNEHDGPRTLLTFTYPNTIVAGNNYK